MTISETTCLIAKCDGCDDGWQDSEDGGTPHFADLDDLRRYLLDEDGGGWSEDDGVLLCKGCAADHVCFVEGHEWGDWYDCLCATHGARHEVGMRHRSCMRCGNGRESEPNGEPTFLGGLTALGYTVGKGSSPLSAPARVQSE